MVDHPSCRTVRRDFPLYAMLGQSTHHYALQPQHAPCAELRVDFAADGVARYAVAFPATATMTLWASILHLDLERRRHEVIAIEAHDSNNSSPRSSAGSPVCPGLVRKGFAKRAASDCIATVIWPVGRRGSV